MKKKMTQREIEITDLEIDIGKVNQIASWRKGFFHEVAERLYDMGYRKLSIDTKNSNETEKIKKDIAELKDAIVKLEIKDDVIINTDVDRTDPAYVEVVFIANYVYKNNLYKTEISRVYCKFSPSITIKVILNKDDFALLQRRETTYPQNGNSQERKDYLYLSKRFQNIRNIDKNELEYLCKEYKLDILQQGEE